MDDIIAMCQAVNPYVTNPLMLAVLGIVPFNLIKRGVESVLTLLLYKKISPLMKNYIRK